MAQFGLIQLRDVDITLITNIPRFLLRCNQLISSRVLVIIKWLKFLDLLILQLDLLLQLLDLANVAVLHEYETFVFLDELGHVVALPDDLLLHLMQVGLGDLDVCCWGLDVFLYSGSMGDIL